MDKSKLRNPSAFEKKRIGDIWTTNDGSIWLIIDDNPETKDSLTQYGFTFSTCVELETKEKIKHRYNSYIAAPESFMELVLMGSPKRIQKNRYIDLRRIMKTSNNAFINQVGKVSQDCIIEILIKREELEEKLNQLIEGKRNPVMTHYDYDVAISFAGEEREIAKSIALGLRDKNFSVFFDEFESSMMWGSDLGQLLDVIYRKKSHFCMVLISRSYQQKIWTKHEFRSALSRRITENPNYILPIRIDNTELDGLQPTTGYVRYKELIDIGTIIELFTEKFKKIAERKVFPITAKWIENLKRINEVWGIDCLAFSVDSRYVPDAEGDIEQRLGVSYGINVTVPRMGFLAPSEQKGKNVLGIHLVTVNKKRELCLVDKWFASSIAYDVSNIHDAISQTKEYLNNISNEKYKQWVSCAGSSDILLNSDFNELDEFSEIISEGMLSDVVNLPAEESNIDESKHALTWADVDEALRAGAVEGVPAGTDLEEFIWQNIPDARPEIEARNPGRKFSNKTKNAD